MPWSHDLGSNSNSRTWSTLTALTHIEPCPTSVKTIPWTCGSALWWILLLGYIWVSHSIASSSLSTPALHSMLLSRPSTIFYCNTMHEKKGKANLSSVPKQQSCVATEASLYALNLVQSCPRDSLLNFSWQPHYFLCNDTIFEMMAQFSPCSCCITHEIRIEYNFTSWSVTSLLVLKKNILNLMGLHWTLGNCIDYWKSALVSMIFALIGPEIWISSHPILHFQTANHCTASYAQWWTSNIHWLTINCTGLLALHHWSPKMDLLPRCFNSK